MAAFSSSSEKREASRAIAAWLESVLEGGLENYKLQAQHELEPKREQETLTSPRTMPSDSGKDYS